MFNQGALECSNQRNDISWNNLTNAVTNRDWHWNLIKDVSLSWHKSLKLHRQSPGLLFPMKIPKKTVVDLVFFISPSGLTCTWGQQSSCDGFNLCGEKRKHVNLILTPKHSEAMAFVVFPSHNLSYERPIIRVSGGSKSLKQNDIIGCFITGSKAFHLFVCSNAREFFCCDPYSSWSHL